MIYKVIVSFWAEVEEHVEFSGESLFAVCFE